MFKKIGLLVIFAVILSVGTIVFCSPVEPTEEENKIFTLVWGDKSFDFKVRLVWAEDYLTSDQISHLFNKFENSENCLTIDSKEMNDDQKKIALYLVKKLH